MAEDNRPSSCQVCLGRDEEAYAVRQRLKLFVIDYNLEYRKAKAAGNPLPPQMGMQEWARKFIEEGIENYSD